MRSASEVSLESSLNPLPPRTGSKNVRGDTDFPGGSKLAPPPPPAQAAVAGAAGEAARGARATAGAAAAADGAPIKLVRRADVLDELAPNARCGARQKR
eukprot:9100432-Pyramimonas_sp.AAC.1